MVLPLVELAECVKGTSTSLVSQECTSFKTVFRNLLEVGRIIHPSCKPILLWSAPHSSIFQTNTPYLIYNSYIR